MNLFRSLLLCWLAVSSVFLFSRFALGQMPDLPPLAGTGALTPSQTDQFSFIFAGDNRPAHRSCSQPPVPGMIFSAAKQMQPTLAFMIWGGDTVYGKEPAPNSGDKKQEKKLSKEYKEFLAIAATGGVPVFNAPGNHELDDKDDVPNDTMKQWYKQFTQTRTYGAFTYGNSRFIALDSENELPAEKPSGAGAKGSKNEAPGYITPKQLKLLQQDLDSDTGLAHIFIFFHHPVCPAEAKDGLMPDNVRQLKELLANYKNVSYVLNSHEHMYYNCQGTAQQITPPSPRTDPSSDPPDYLVSGGAGAPLKDLPGGFYHYLVFKVNGNSVTPELKKVDCSGGACDSSCTK